MERKLCEKYISKSIPRKKIEDFEYSTRGFEQLCSDCIYKGTSSCLDYRPSTAWTAKEIYDDDFMKAQEWWDRHC